MAKLLHFITVGKDKLRCGYTTGTCAAAAALGCARRLIYGRWEDSVSILTPAGITVEAELLEKTCGEDFASCAVCKDGGDDPDVTNGELVFAQVGISSSPGIKIDGGVGVGRVTKRGLDQPVGVAAINTVPRKMITEALLPLIGGAVKGLSVTISVPNGQALAEKTFNPRLGIMGGISILGTSGIVRPMSEAALIDSVMLEINTIRAAGSEHLLLTPGNYGEGFSRDILRLSMKNRALCSNYIGQAIDCAANLGFKSVLLVGHLGKLIKVAAGNMNTHSQVSDGRAETLSAHTALCGGDTQLVREIFACPTTDSAVELLQAGALRDPVMRSVSQSLQDKLQRRAGEMQIEAVFFSNKFGILGTTAGATRLLEIHRYMEEEK